MSAYAAVSNGKRKFVVCPFDYEETNGSYPFSNGLNGSPVAVDAHHKQSEA
jgi:hypothetical protein